MYSTYNRTFDNQNWHNIRLVAIVISCNLTKDLVILMVMVGSWINVMYASQLYSITCILPNWNE